MAFFAALLQQLLVAFSTSTRSSGCQQSCHTPTPTPPTSRFQITSSTFSPPFTRVETYRRIFQDDVSTFLSDKSLDVFLHVNTCREENNNDNRTQRGEHSCWMSCSNIEAPSAFLLQTTFLTFLLDVQKFKQWVHPDFLTLRCKRRKVVGHRDSKTPDPGFLTFL